MSAVDPSKASDLQTRGSGHRIEAIFVGTPRSHPDGPDGGEWLTALVKHAVEGPVRLGEENLQGDRQADLVDHGGPDKAICLYPRGHYETWAQEDLDLVPPAFGENLSVGSIDERDVCIGDVFAIGEAAIQVSQPRAPCWKVSRRWGVPRLAAMMQRTGRTGWYARVTRPGVLEAGQPAELLDRPHPTWTVSAVNDVMYRRRHDVDAATELADLDALSTSWRQDFAERVERLAEGGGD